MNYNHEDQYQSMLRAYEALRTFATDIGKTAVIGDHAAGDAAKSFFIACYHFKDWIKVSIAESVGERWFQSAGNAIFSAKHGLKMHADMR